ncbi:unnamed protein product [Acanthoscelides obtectus]|uniref:BPTI/Kunitz inhibitor domain-containing protein n=1 Tax=Acanthoscelides obtectus TaxID=200917 RepID=A0A9P0JMC8_ACAOB|nr:unnamed protein product [Acanthoscelides obtectus]CAK1634879.1 hypothetical protein AOBTE_LOCUS8939 [Acanthoscelides obtectus]
MYSRKTLILLAVLAVTVLSVGAFDKSDCAKNVEDGPIACLAYIKVYKWSPADNKCVSATYGGCHATNNNFPTENDCNKVAKPVCSS